MQRLILFLLLLVCSTSAVAGERVVDYVVLVSVDGLSASYLTDQRARMPNLRAIAQTGAAASGMVTSFPSVTWPSHVSVVTGVHPARHGVIGNSVWNRGTDGEVKYIGDPVLTKEQAIQVPTLYDIAHEAGLSTASVIWPCSNGAKSLQWVIPDSNKPELHARYTTPGFADELAAAGIDISQLGAWGWEKKRATQRDTVYTRIAQHLLTKHKVELILLHLITPDAVEHGFGPQTPAAYQAIEESDQHIGEIWETLQQPPFAGRATLVVVSDHGFAPYERLIRPNIVLRRLGLLTTDDKKKVVERRAWCVAQGGSAFVYALDDGARQQIVEQLTQELSLVEGVTSVLTPAEFKALGLPGPDSNAEAPDLILTTEPGYSFNSGLAGEEVSDAAGYLGSHGHDPRQDFMHATFVAAGRGIQPGTDAGLIRNVDVAPTIAHLLGLEMDADGEVLTHILSSDAR